MKNIFAVCTILLICCSFFNGYSASTANYILSTNTTGSLVDMSVGTTQLIAANKDDEASAVTNIGFDFWFMGQKSTQFSVSSNGGMKLGASAITMIYASGFPAASELILAPFLGDLATSNTGKVHYKITGLAPNRVLVVEYLNIALDYSSTTGDLTFQVLLNETTGVIEFRYGNMSCGSSSFSNYVAVGISSNTGDYNFLSVNQDDFSIRLLGTPFLKNYTSTGVITNFSSSSDGSRRTITFSPSAINAPTALNFSQINAQSANLYWTDNSSDEDGFLVYKSTDGGTTFSFEGTSGANVTSFVASNLVPSTPYIFAVCALREILSTPVTCEVILDPLPLELSTFTAAAKERNIILSWETKTEINTSHFIIERTAKDHNEYTAVGKIDASGNTNTPVKYSFTDNKLVSGKFNYRLKMNDNDGTFKYSPVVEAEIEIPRSFSLSQNYPNPFNPSTKIDYQLPEDAQVTLELYNITGEKAAVLLNSEQSAGYYTIDVNASSIHNLSSGLYIYRITAISKREGSKFIDTKKMMMLK